MNTDDTERLYPIYREEIRVKREYNERKAGGKSRSGVLLGKYNISWR